MTNHQLPALLLVPVLLCASVATSHAATFTGLGDLPGGDYSSGANAISADGSTVVGSSASGSGTEAFRWTSSGGMVGLGYLSGGTLPLSRANAVSADGSVVAGESRSFSNFSEAFRWTSSGGMVGLGTLHDHGSAAHGISGDGSVVVGGGDGATGIEAFRWTSSGGMIGLGYLPGTAGVSEANGVSEDGTVVVGKSGGAFRWTSSSGMVSLGNLHGGIISADGSVIVGYSSASPGNRGAEAFRWTSGEGMVSLGNNNPGGAWSKTGDAFFVSPNAVSADGSVIVGTVTAVIASGFSFIWDSENGIRELQDVLENDFGLASQLNGWNIWRATGISADGKTIVGTGRNPSGFSEAWIATIPEPATLTLLALGLSGLVGCGRRSRRR